MPFCINDPYADIPCPICGNGFDADLAPSEVLDWTAKMRRLGRGGGHAAARVHHTFRRYSGRVAAAVRAQQPIPVIGYLSARSPIILRTS